MYNCEYQFMNANTNLQIIALNYKCINKYKIFDILLLLWWLLLWHQQ